MPVESTTISVSRDSGYADRLRDYRVFLDELEIGRIGNAETKSFVVTPGQHQLALKVDWCRSNAISFGIVNGQSVKFICGSNLRGPNLGLSLYYMVFARSNYLWLKVV